VVCARAGGVCCACAVSETGGLSSASSCCRASQRLSLNTCSLQDWRTSVPLPRQVYTSQELQLQSASASRGCAKRALMQAVVAVYMRASMRVTCSSLPCCSHVKATSLACILQSYRCASISAALMRGENSCYRRSNRRGRHALRPTP
jgi:hypothetical protein